MLLEVLKSKLHGAVVTQSNVDYTGSITIDETLMKAADIVEYERVLIGNLTNGNRVETYVIKGRKDSGVIGMNGAAAHLCKVGDKILIMSFALLDEKELKKHKPKIVFLNDDNKIKQRHK
jgi:aspartate 1-decarboxylase